MYHNVTFAKSNLILNTLIFFRLGSSKLAYFFYCGYFYVKQSLEFEEQTQINIFLSNYCMY